MHCCLFISEVLQVIADSVHSDKNRTLLSMALTCHAFFDPAMNALWRTLLGPRHLIRILPERTRGTEYLRQLTITAQPSEAEWRRFEEYARRVRTLWYCSEEDFGKESPSVDWQSVTKYYPGDQLFPNLRGLAVSNDLGSASLPLFIRPPLRHLSLHWFDLNGLAPLIEALPKSFTSLETLRIYTVDAYKADKLISGGIVSRAITKLQALTVLHVEVLLPETLEHLASLPTLCELQFVVQVVGPATSPLRFSALKRLDVKTWTDNPSPLLSFLRRLSAPALQGLKIIFEAYNPAVAMTHGNWDSRHLRPTAAYVHAVLAAVFRLPHIHSFTFEGPMLAPSSSPDPQHTLDITTLSPLLALHDLETLVMHHVPIRFVPADIESMARAWPKMKSLRLSDADPRIAYAVQYVGVEDLLPFVRHCPGLCTLGLPVRIPETFAPAVVLLAGKPRSAVQELFVLDIDKKFSPDAVAFLADVFPCAVLAQSFGDAGTLQAVNDMKEFLLKKIHQEDSNSNSLQDA